MQAPCGLRLLRPLLAKPAQLRAGGTRLVSKDCDTEKKVPDCEPCVPAPQPPCRGRPAEEITGKRVVCCPPPQGKLPPCAAKLPPCPISCENLPKIKLSSPLPTEDPCGAMDRVAQMMRDQEEDMRRQYEAEVEARKALPQKPWPEVNCKLSSPETPESQEMATDGRSYTVLPGQPPPPKCPPPECPPGTARKPPEPQLVRLKRPACAAAGSDLCAHKPRTLVSIDRSPAPDPVCPDKCANVKPRSESPEPRPLPKKLCDSKKGKGLKARIMETLNRGRSTSPADGAASGCSRSSEEEGWTRKSIKDKSWCKEIPGPAPTPPCCVKPSMPDLIVKRTPKPDCNPIAPPLPPGARRLHTSVAAEAAKPAADRDATIAAAKKLKATLEERDKLNEAGRGRTVLPPVCEEAPRPPPKPSGGALELGVPPGADTVCVRVSVGSGGGAPPASPCARAGPPTPCAAAPGGGPASDSWLSIKSLQQKLSGRQPCAAKPAESRCGPSPAAPKPKPLAQPTSANPCAKNKMTDIIPKTIFIKTS